MLQEAGYHQRTDSKELVVTDPDNDVEFFYLRPRDVAVYVGSGQLDVGITGRDLLIDSAAAAREELALGFARSTFRFAGVTGSATTLADLQGMSIATSALGTRSRLLEEQVIRFRIRGGSGVDIRQASSASCRPARHALSCGRECGDGSVVRVVRCIGQSSITATP
jgi:ATP phosphoribosyltransferase